MNRATKEKGQHGRCFQSEEIMLNTATIVALSRCHCRPSGGNRILNEGNIFPYGPPSEGLTGIDAANFSTIGLLSDERNPWIGWVPIDQRIEL